MHVTYLVKVVR